uniref:Uncharacterized protein n=1 Tax=Onchocerca volvulus TaxID=6282 RepID=A0A8R1U1S9_ONCVO
MAVFVRNDSWRKTVHPPSQLLDINDESLISRYDNMWHLPHTSPDSPQRFPLSSLDESGNNFIETNDQVSY